ncbi:MAG TPA: aminopeptidase [Thermodesulfovibrionales bacterium]|nr:aminopeptidase [Thermodesulfovibrionales bacterium]
MITSTLRDIFRINLGVKEDEKVLIFTDRPSEREEIDEVDKNRRLKLRCFSLFAAEIGKNICKTVIFHEYPATGSHGAEPPEELWEFAFGKKALETLRKEKLLLPLLLKNAEDREIKRAEEIIRRYKKNTVDCVIAISNYSTSHTRFRDFLTRICGCRYASMPLFDITMLEGAMHVDWKALAKRTEKIAKEVNRAEFVEVKTRNGSFISFSKKGRKAGSDTGILKKPGSFGNLPAGEVYIAPLEGTARGRLILEWAPTRHLSSPIILMIKDGIVVNIEGEEAYVEYLRGKLDERKENSNIAEFGIGTNDRATRLDNILESEKILGTIHIALGDNSSFGGKVKTPFHQDFIFLKPTVTLIHKDGSKQAILKSGKLICEGCA